MALEYIVSRIKAGLWTFSKLVFNSNRDYPYHDFIKKDLWDGVEREQ